VLVGPARPGFVPFGELPDYVIRAITTSEDASFFAHRGFDFGELRNALAEAGQAGKLGRGGSTITQQLAKNLFLSRERTLARKVKEALVTVALEGSLSKARLLEIYLNVIEWGPGLHGLGPAAKHYFGKDARALTPREACFLAAAIPSPLRTHAAVAAGVPAERWNARIEGLLAKLGAVGVLTGDQLDEARGAPLRFAAGVQPPSAAEAAAAVAEGTEAAEPVEPEPADGAAAAPPAGKTAGVAAGGAPR
jgi:membrane peptidoglycan carboxypeptidase